MDKLPLEIVLRARQVFTCVLKYAYELLTLDTMMKVTASTYDPVPLDPPRWTRVNLNLNRFAPICRLSSARHLPPLPYPMSARFKL